MSTSKTDTQQIQFDPTSMGTMQSMLGPGTGSGGGFRGGFNPSGGSSAIGGFQNPGGRAAGMGMPFGATAGGQQAGQAGGGLGNVTANYINNPFGNPFFQTQQQMGTRQAQNLGGTQMSDLMRNLTSSGLQGGGFSPAGVEMQQNQSRANTGMQANLGFLQPMQNALQQQNFYSQLASQFRPLQTGGKQTETTGGLGTWLPQLAGAALGGLTGMAGGGGLSHLFGGGGGGMGQLFQAQNPSLFGQMPQQGTGFAGSSSGMGGWQGPSSFQMPQLSGGGGMAPPPFPGLG